MWAVIRTAGLVSVVVAPFSDYDEATRWAKQWSNDKVGCTIVPLYKPNAWNDPVAATRSITP